MPQRFNGSGHPSSPAQRRTLGDLGVVPDVIPRPSGQTLTISEDLMGVLEVVPFDVQPLTCSIVLRVTPWTGFIELVVQEGGHEVAHKEQPYGHPLDVMVIDGHGWYGHSRQLTEGEALMSVMGWMDNDDHGQGEESSRRLTEDLVSIIYK